MDFIDLDRYFVPLTKDQEPSLDIGRFWGARVSGWLGWEELRRRRRVILLAEAASGKTEEFRHQCDTLKAGGSPAFFLRIEELAEQGIEAALDNQSAKLLDTWLAGSGEGWFFLDSVDEARLNRKSFDTALSQLGNSISTRPLDWRTAPRNMGISNIPAGMRETGPRMTPPRTRTSVSRKGSAWIGANQTAGAAAATAGA